MPSPHVSPGLYCLDKFKAYSDGVTWTVEICAVRGARPQGRTGGRIAPSVVTRLANPKTQTQEEVEYLNVLTRELCEYKDERLVARLVMQREIEDGVTGTRRILQTHNHQKRQGREVSGGGKDGEGQRTPGGEGRGGLVSRLPPPQHLLWGARCRPRAEIEQALWERETLGNERAKVWERTRVKRALYEDHGINVTLLRLQLNNPTH